MVATLPAQGLLNSVAYGFTDPQVSGLWLELCSCGRRARSSLAPDDLPPSLQAALHMSGSASEAGRGNPSGAAGSLRRFESSEEWEHSSRQHLLNLQL